MNPEHKEIAIWAGGTLLVVIIGWIVIGSRAGTVRDQGDLADQQHARYTELYLTPGSNDQPAQQVLARLGQLHQEQQAELQGVEDLVVWPGLGEGIPPEFINARFDGSTGDIDYTTALTRIGDVASRLKRRGESLGITMPATLPYEEQGGLSNEDPALLSLQMAQICTYAALMDLAMDSGVRSIAPIQLDPARAWVDPTGQYAIVSATTMMECSYESADVMLRALNDNRFGLAVQRAVLDYQADSGAQGFRFTLGVTLTLRNREAWGLSEQSEAAAQQRVGTSEVQPRGPRRTVR